MLSSSAIPPIPNTYSYAQRFPCRILFCYRHRSGQPHLPARGPFTIADYVEQLHRGRAQHFHEVAVDVRCLCRYRNGVLERDARMSTSVQPVFGSTKDEVFHAAVTGYQNFDVVISHPIANRNDGSCIFGNADLIAALFTAAARSPAFPNIFTTLKFTTACDEKLVLGQTPVRELPPSINDHGVIASWRKLIATSRIHTLISGVAQLEYIIDCGRPYVLLEKLFLTLQQPYNNKMGILHGGYALPRLHTLSLDLSDTYPPYVEGYISNPRMFSALSTFNLYKLPPNSTIHTQSDQEFWLNFIRNMITAQKTLRYLSVPVDILYKADPDLAQKLAAFIKSPSNFRAITFHGPFLTHGAHAIHAFAKALEQATVPTIHDRNFRHVHWNTQLSGNSSAISDAVKVLKVAVNKFATFHEP